jgi:hypothetical protein
MNKITVRPQQTIPKYLTDKLLKFYKDQNPRDIFNKRINDLKGVYPTYGNISKFYGFFRIR